MGADYALDPTDEAIFAKIDEIIGGRGLRSGLRVRGCGHNAQAAHALGRRGGLILVGITPDPVWVGQGIYYVRYRHTVTGHTGCQMRHLEELVGLVTRGRLDVSGSISAVLPLEDVAEGSAGCASTRGIRSHLPASLSVTRWKVVHVQGVRQGARSARPRRSRRRSRAKPGIGYLSPKRIEATCFSKPIVPRSATLPVMTVDSPVQFGPFQSFTGPPTRTMDTAS